MKTLLLAELSDLPCQAGGLVADGVWSLYELEVSGLDAPSYVLLTSRGSEHYLLSSRGNPMLAVLSLDDLSLGAAVLIRDDRPSVRVVLTNEKGLS